MFGFKARMRRRHSFRRRWQYRLTLFLLGALILPWPLIGLMRWLPPPTTMFILEARVRLHQTDARFKGIKQRWVPYESISPAMRLAVVAAEDQRFLEHDGFDWKQISRARNHNNHHAQRVRGASTISQQVAKNIFLWHDRSWLRKGMEAYLTVVIETLWPKKRILEVYLNIAQFDERTFGVSEAGRLLLRKTKPDRITASQAALLAAVLPSPNAYKAVAPSPYVRARQYWILRQMARLGPDHLKPLES